MLDMEVVKQEILALAVIYHNSKGEFVYATLNDERVDKLVDVMNYIMECGFTRMQAIDVFNNINSVAI
jgi:hypothetical protein